MTNKWMNAASAAVLSFGLIGAPVAFAQDATQNDTQVAPTAPMNNQTTPMDPTTTMPPAEVNPTTPGTPTTPSVPAPNDTASLMPSIPLSDITGSNIKNSNGEDVATLDTVLIQPNGQITDGVVAVGGFMGLGTKKVKVAWNEFQFSPTDHTLVLAKSNEEIEAMPEYVAPEKPAERSGTTTTDSTVPAAPAQPGTGGVTN